MPAVQSGLGKNDGNQGMKDEGAQKRLVSIAGRSITILCAMTAAISTIAAQDRPDALVPSFRLKSLEGHEYSLEDVAKRTLGIIVFWATWGKDSGRALGDMEVLFRKYHERGLTVFGICVEDQVISPASRQKIAKSIERSHVSFPVVLDEKLQVFHHCGVVAVPTVLVVDSRGKILRRLSGYTIVGRTALKDFVVEQFEGRRAPQVASTHREPASIEVIPLCNLARKNLARGDFDAAKRHALKARGVDSLFIELHLLLAEIGIESGDTVLALESLKRVQAYERHSADGVRLRGLLLAKQGRTSAAIELLDLALKADSLSALTHCYLGYAYGMGGSLERALGEFAAAETISKDEYRIPRLRAEVYQRHGKIDEARADRARARRLVSPR